MLLLALLAAHVIALPWSTQLAELTKNAKDAAFDVTQFEVSERLHRKVFRRASRGDCWYKPRHCVSFEVLDEFLDRGYVVCADDDNEHTSDEIYVVIGWCHVEELAKRYEQTGHCYGHEDYYDTQ